LIGSALLVTPNQPCTIVFAPLHGVFRSLLNEVDPISDSFDFLMVLYSIIIGIGMSQILVAVGHILQTDKAIRLYWIHTAWAFLIFLLHIFVWFNAWEYRAIETWEFSQFLIFLSVPVILFIASVITFPDIYQEKEYDLRDYYYASSGWLHALSAVLIVIVSINESMLLDQQLFVWQNGIRVVAFLVLLVGFPSRHPRVHASQVIALYGLLSISAWVFRGTIS
jgi:hypothetical protein